ncbi:TetR/AcrR family transcriptional regulator [Achromobacter xylosoxidans]
MASALFARNGFRAVSIGDIVEESQVASMTLYNNFKSKDDLMVAVLEDRHAKVMATLRQILQDCDGVDAKLQTLFAWHTEWFNSDDFSGCLFEKALAEFSQEENDARQVAVKHKAALTNLIRDVLRERYPETVATELARTILILLDGATASAWALQHKDAADRTWKATQVLLRDAAAQGKPHPKPRKRAKLPNTPRSGTTH